MVNKLVFFGALCAIQITGRNVDGKEDNYMHLCL